MTDDRPHTPTGDHATTPDNVPVSRAVGRFFGHLWHAVKANPKRDRTEVSRRVEHQESQGPSGERVTLRRTTIEEVEVEKP